MWCIILVYVHKWTKHCTYGTVHFLTELLDIQKQLKYCHEFESKDHCNLIPIDLSKGPLLFRQWKGQPKMGQCAEKKPSQTFVNSSFSPVLVWFEREQRLPPFYLLKEKQFLKHLLKLARINAEHYFNISNMCLKNIQFHNHIKMFIL